MIKENQSFFNKMHVLLDALIIISSYMLAWFLRFRSGIFTIDGYFLSLGEYMQLLFILVPGYLIIYLGFHLYTPKRVQGRRLEAARIFQANLIGLMAVILVLYVLNHALISRFMLLLFFVINFSLEVFVRNLVRMFLRRIRKRGYNHKHMVLVGYSRATEQYIDRIIANPGWGYTIRGILDDNQPRGKEYRGVKVIGSIENLLIILPQNRIDEIAITLGLSEYHKLEKIVNMCEKSGVHTKFIPDYNKIIPTRPYTEDILGLPVVNIRHLPLNNVLYRTTKRFIDIVGAFMALLLFTPLMMMIGILIKAGSPGRVIFKQERIGLGNKPFRMYKFRSMVEQTDADEQGEWTTKDDPRVTKTGRWIRRTSMDELPQLFNVLRGDMSLVGPRPERPLYVEKFKEEIPRYMVKHQVRPGLTGWAQINGYRGDTSIEKRIEYDLYYLENWTPGLDVKIILLTFFRGFVNKNAY